MAEKPRPSIPNFELPEQLEPVYSNLARISHSPTEFVLDMARMLPGLPNPVILARLLMSPVGAKLFARALNDNLARYEMAFGEIVLPGDANLAEDLFRSIQPPDGPANGN